MKRLRKLAELSLTLSGEPVDIFNKIARMIGELLEVKIVCLSEIQGETLLFLSVYNNGKVFIDAGQCQLANTPCATVQNTKDFRIYHDVSSAFPEAVFLKEHNAYSYCGFPALDNEGNVVAVICLLDDKHHDYTEEDEDLLRIFGQRIGFEIERKKRMAEKKKSDAQLARREAEFEAIFNSISDVVVFVNGRRRVRMVNSAMETVFGYTQEELQGKETRFLYENPGDFDEQGKIRYNAGAQEQPQIYRMQYRKKDGTTFPGETLGTPVRDHQGNVLGYVGIIRDITDQLKAQKQLEEETLKAQKLESTGVLAGGIAHDFNNILTAIVGNISLAKIHAGANSKITNPLTSAENAAARARDLSQQLLTFSKGGQPIRKPAQLGELINESAAFALTGSNVTCSLQISDHLRPVNIDKGQISQVIQNVVKNADQAMPEGGTIAISAENTTIGGQESFSLKKGKYVWIKIQDQGPGIPKKDLTNIFDPYFSTKKEGSGLGLAVSFSIIKKHDGFISAESESGTGTTFHIYLPASEGQALVGEKQANETLPQSSKKILLMDDDLAILDVATHMLDMMNFKVETATNGQEAVALYRKAQTSGDPFTGVILDLTVPGGMGGKETLKELIRIDPRVKALVSSGYANDPVMAEYKRHGFKSFVPKPYNIAQLGNALRDLLD
ncbi:MAG: PAS domain S-box protein [Desulfobulbaceae bacterium]|nr:PAS domain S-box protein [Desulfobulbaceae bacterium]